MFKLFRKRKEPTINELADQVATARRAALRDAEKRGCLESTVDDMLLRLAQSRLSKD